MAPAPGNETPRRVQRKRWDDDDEREYESRNERGNRSGRGDSYRDGRGGSSSGKARRESAESGEKPFREETDARGRFVPGNTAHGRNASRIRTTIQQRRAMFDAFMAAPGRTGAARIQEIYDALYDSAMEGDTKAMKYLADQSIGRAMQPITVSGDPENPIALDVNRYL